jgi:phosphohistidine phosphatase
MNLYLLRHAEAEAEAASDDERQLTERGREQARTIGRFCARNDLYPGKILTSPMVRAKQTAKIVADELKISERIQVCPFAAVGMTAEAALGELKRFEEHSSVLLVGHEPDLSEFVAALLGGEEESVRIRKAGLAKVTLPKLKLGVGRLEFLLPVKFL